MGRLIDFADHRHDATRHLLAWYATGQLDAGERASVDAHLASCAECREDVRAERRLAAGVAETSPGVEQGWAALRARLDAPDARGSSPPALMQRLAAQGRGVRTGWLIAAQLAFAMLIGGALLLDRAPAYHALGSAPASRDGTMIVMFRPGARESDVRRAVIAGGARLVDGPTQAGAYVLGAPVAARPAALAALRHDPSVLLAQPIDPPR